MRRMSFARAKSTISEFLSDVLPACLGDHRPDRADLGFHALRHSGDADR
ncbi:hypothetical protein WIS52_20120 [Pseudonocardia nematodicida]|uniref:Uncharacterized protein n=1 Tax=Pseudonocardia nematodicida TaxID=1206997 RepID=A0ABV1KEA0_9PSEU